MIGIVIGIWLLLGAGCALVLVRRGHSPIWFALVFFGPLLPLLAFSEKDAATPDLPPGVPASAGGPIDVLVGIDGSAASRAAAEHVVSLLGPRLGRLTVASVLDLDSASWPDVPAGPRSRAEAWLAEEGRSLGALLGRAVGTEMLAGEPADALIGRAVSEGSALIVVGTTGKGAAKALLGSVARRLASSSPVPVLVVPSPQ